MRRGLELETLNVRNLPAVQLVTPVSDVAVLQGATQQTIDLANRYNDTDAQGTIVDMQFNLGTVRVALSDQTTPNTVANFLRYANDARYNNTFVHRSVRNFVVQGGGYSLGTNGAVGVPKFDPVVNEFQANVTSNVRGTIAMAKLGGNPNSATSEWFFNLADNTANLDSQNGGFTTFGRVISGMTTVVDPIATLQIVNAGSPFDTLPVRNFVPGSSITNANLVTLNSITTVRTPSTPNTNSLGYSVTNNNPALVTATLTGSSLQLAYLNGKTGTASIGVTVTGLDGTSVTDTFSVTVAPLASVTGKAFKDLNGNGIKDTGDTTLVGARAYIDANKNGVFESSEKSVLTGSAGEFTISSLPPGSHRVSILPPTAFVFTAPLAGSSTVTLLSGQIGAGINFALAPTGRIQGNLFNDLSGNGIREKGETSFSGWKVYVDSNRNGRLDLTEKRVLTGASGNYTIRNLESGTYRISVAGLSGYRPSYPTLGYHEVFVGAGRAVFGKNFGYTRQATISGMVFNDVNGNKIKNSTETGIANWRVYLDTNKDGIRQSTEASVLTDAKGIWKFGSVKPGYYIVRLVAQPGKALTAPISGFFSLNVAAGQVVTDKNFGVK